VQEPSSEKVLLQQGFVVANHIMTKHRIVIFTQPDCPPCHILKLFFSEKGIAFEQHGISSDPAAAEELTGRYFCHSTSTLVIGEEVMIGFNPERLDEILGE
jgi:arsenate reductase-like glutaredoxin family protein